MKSAGLRSLILAATLGACQSAPAPAPGHDPTPDARLAALTAARPARPAEFEQPWERLSLTLGGLVSTADSSIRFGGEGVGVQVDLEGAFNLDSTRSTVTLDGHWRFSENRRHRLDLSWRDLSRSATRKLKKDLDLGDGTVIPIGTLLDTEFDVSTFKGSYSYSLIQDDRVDLAASFGLYVSPISFSSEGSGIEKFDITAPLPVIGARVDVALTPRLFLRNDFEFFYLSVGGYTGSVRSLGSAIEWVPMKHLGVGLKIESLDLSVDAERSSDLPDFDFFGEIDAGYTGLLVYLRAFL